MLAKLVTLVLALAMTATALLSVRQRRLQAVSDMATAIERAAELDRRTWRVRVEIARRLTPESLGVMIADLGPWAPIRLDEHRPAWCPTAPLAHDEAWAEADEDLGG